MSAASKRDPFAPRTEAQKGKVVLGPERPAASSPEFGTSGTEKSERTAFLQDNADKSQAFPQSAATTPEDDPLIVALLEAHAILAGMQSKGITAFPGPRENAMAKIELATRIRKAEL